MRAIRRFSRGFGVASRVDPESTVFPALVRGVDVDLNFSLAADRVTTRGQAFRNPDVRTLLEFIPRGSAEVRKGKSVATSGAPQAALSVRATDKIFGSDGVVDVEEYEAALRETVEDRLSFAPQLFVQDGSVGASRATEIRTRIITDSPLTALVARAALHRIPLYAPQAFPRTITVYAATRHYPGNAVVPGKVNVDVDPATARASVLIEGAAAPSDILRAVSVAASALWQSGGYRHVPGGSHDPNLSLARSDGVLDRYLRDGHFYAPATEPHPDIAFLPPGAVTLLAAPSGELSVVIGQDSGSVVAGPAAASGRLRSTSGAVWHATEGVSAPFACATLAAPALGSLALPEGSLLQAGQVVMPWLHAATRSFGSPARVLIIGERGAAATDQEAAVAAIAKAAGWGDVPEKCAAQIKARLSGATVHYVADAKAATAALGK